MNFAELKAAHFEEIVQLFEATFTASEGVEEGKVIGDLSRNLINETVSDDIFVFGAAENSSLEGCIIFTRLTYGSSKQNVFVMGPVAVASNAQRQGIGQKLIEYGLKQLQAEGVDVAVTYGDPGYYTKSGFVLVSEDQLPAPYNLQYPEGWLAQSLTKEPLPHLDGPCQCVKAYQSPQYW